MYSFILRHQHHHQHQHTQTHTSFLSFSVDMLQIFDLVVFFFFLYFLGTSSPIEACILTEEASHPAPLTGCCSLPDGRLVTSSLDRTLRVWQCNPKKDLQRMLILKGHTDNILTVAVLPDGRVASGSEDNTIRVWATRPGEKGECLLVLKGHRHWIRTIAVLPNGMIIR